jgi:hypothetical protein
MGFIYWDIVLMTVLLLFKKPRNKNDFEVCNYNYLVISLDNFCQDELLFFLPSYNLMFLKLL